MIQPKCECGDPWSKHLPHCIRCDCKKYVAKQYKPKPYQSRFPKRRMVGYKRWILAQPCVLTRLSAGQRGLVCTGYSKGAGELIWDDGTVAIDPAHTTKTQGAGADDAGMIVPLEHGLHVVQHDIGIQTFRAIALRRFKVDLIEAAKAYWIEYEKQEVGVLV